VPLAEALLRGGITAMELTLRTEAALEGLREIRQQVPDMLVGCGTVLETGQVDQVLAVGAAFGVAPGLDARVVRHAIESGLPFAPGILTPTDVGRAVELGCRLLKFFPAEISGGLEYLRTIAAPFDHLGIQYLPLGGLNPANAAGYLAEHRLVAAIGGSWLVPRSAVESGNWERVELLAREASELVAQIRES